VWADVRGFLENPGEALERVREQLRGTDHTEELVQRREDLAKRLANKQAEKDRYVRLYAQGHISETELELYLADLKNQINNLRLLIESVEADLSQKHQHKELAETTHAWLVTLRERIAEVEEDSVEAFRVRRQFVKLLVEGITVGVRREDGRTETLITYRFDPPEDAGGEDVFADTVPNNGAFVMPSKLEGGASGGMSTSSPAARCRASSPDRTSPPAARPCSSPFSTLARRVRTRRTRPAPGPTATSLAPPSSP
jgi:hypothetical protein